MSVQVNGSLKDRKVDLLAHFRGRAEEIRVEATRIHGHRNTKKVAARLNKELGAERTRVEGAVRQCGSREQWSTQRLLETLLIVKHCSNVAMIEARNEVWVYEYMTLSRRVGELWEPLIATCFEHAPNPRLKLFVPPVFADVRDRLHAELRSYIETLPLAPDAQNQLVAYYEKVWTLVDSGEIHLALDMHFSIDARRYVVDFKSGFGSNEKGNTNRLLLVASIYMNIEPEDYRPVMLVRSPEDESNNYLQRIKRSGLWKVYCGAAAYEQIEEYTGFSISGWIAEHIHWHEDLSPDTWRYFEENDLVQYLRW